MKISLDKYKVFYEAANCGSFSDAAKNLFITQSAVSQHIRLLENELGVMLFARGRKGAKLTSQGELLYGYVKRSIEEIENAETLFTRMKTLDEGSLRIGAGDTITRHFLMDALEHFHNTYPSVKIEIVNRVTNETLKRLIAGKIDIAFVSLPIDKSKHPNVEVKEIGKLHDIFIAGSKYDHLKNKTLSINEIASLPLAMLEPKSNTRYNTDLFFQSHGLKLNPEFELGSYDLLFDFAEKNLGIACITEEFSKSIGSKNVFKLTTDFSLPERSIGICTLANVPPSPAVSRLIEIIESVNN